MGERPVPLLFLDIDGTVREGKDDRLGRFVNGPEDVIVFPAAVKRMRAWKAGGGRIIGVSNQGGIALRIVTMERVTAAMLTTQRQCEGLFDKLAWCMHHPDAEHPEMARCWCRKPRPGLAIEAALSLADGHPGEIYPPYMALFVGDRPEDQQCAKALNIDFEWASDWRGLRRTPRTPAMADPMSDEQDQLYLKLKGARERLCLAQHLVPPHWTSDLSQAIAIIDNVGSSLVPIWSADNQPEYPEPKT